MKMLSRINCFSSSINEIRNSHMNPRCKLIASSNPQLIHWIHDWNNSLEEPASIYHISEPIMNENSPKNVLFSSYRSTLNSFIQLCEEHCATVWHISKIFIPFSFRFIFSPFNASNFWCVFTKTIILLGLAEYERIITNSALRASLVIYHLIFGAPS